MSITGILRTISVGLMAILSSVSARAADTPIVVLTSYPEELTGLYEKAFEQAHPGMDVQILWQQGGDAMATLRKPDHGGVDVYWAPSLHNFPVLAQDGTFAKFTVDRQRIPGRVGDQPVSDPNGYFEAFEIAGHGMVVNPALLTARGMAAPTRWNDLARPEYSGLVVMPVASRIGFSPELYDIILQGQGWSEGWSLLSEISANAVLTEKGGDIVNSVVDGKAAAALAIDFLARNAMSDGKPVSLVYPERTAFLPAYVAIVASAPHRGAAETFAKYLLSREGQSLLFRPESGRYPVRPDVYAAAPKGTVDPFTLPAGATFAYDLDLGPARSPLIAALFDTAIVARAERVKTMWSAIHQAESEAARTNNAKTAAQIAEARALAGWVPVTEKEAADRAYLAQFEPRGRTPNPAGVAIAQSWAMQMDEKQSRALVLAQSALGASPP